VDETGSDIIKDFTLAGGVDALDLKDLLVDEHADAASLDTYLDFSENSLGQTVITVDANAGGLDGTGQTITLENVQLYDLQVSASYTGNAGSASDIAILTRLLADGNLKTDH
jgi:Zn-dependent alcohol dehydrogenase